MNKSIFSNIFWQVAEQGTRILCGIIISGIIARTLGVDQFGQFQYALAVIAIFTSATYLCGAEVVVPKFVEHKTNQNLAFQYLYSAFILRFFASVLAYSALLLYAYFFVTNPITKSIFPILGIVVLISEPFNITVAWLQAKMYLKPKAIWNICAVLIKLCLFILITFLGYQSLINFAYLWIIDIVLIAGIGTLYLFKIEKFKIINFESAILKSLSKTSGLFFFALIAWFIFQKLDRIVLNNIGTPLMLGTYSAAMQLVENINFLSIIIINSLAALIYKESDLKIIKRKIIHLCLALMGIGLVICTLVTILAPYIILIIFGSHFSETVTILQTLVWVCLLVYLDNGLNIYLVKMSKPKLIFCKWMLNICVFFAMLHIVGTISTNPVNIIMISIYIAYFAGIILQIGLVFNKCTNVTSLKL